MFDNIKFYVKDFNTGEIELHFICEGCGKEMIGLNNPDIYYQIPVVGPGGPLAYHKMRIKCKECYERAKEDGTLQ